MYGLFNFLQRRLRFVVALGFVFALFSSTVGTLFAAGTTGTISGTITDAKSGKPLAGVTVAAVSPTGSFRTATDGKGFFAINGVTPDTYTVSLQLQGFEPTSTTGVTVSVDQTADVSARLTGSLSTIVRVRARGAGGAFQPKETQDTYTVTTQQINTLLGKADAISETALLTRLPGASLDKYGYPVLRGGRENEEGFEFDGIPLVDAFTSQFTNSLTLNGNVAQLQLSPGAGDVTTGGAGTGSINLVAKRGTYPAFGTLDAESLLAPYNHQLALEYGFATPNGRLSNYISFLGFNGAYGQFGEFGTAASSLSPGVFYSPAYNNNRDILENFVYKFGRNNGQSFQFLLDNQQSNFLGTYGGNQTGVGYATADPYTLANFLRPYTQLTTAQLQDPTIVGLIPGQSSLSSLLSADNRGASNSYQPNNTIKFQYTNNLSSASFLSAKFYELDAVTTFDEANNANGGFFSNFVALQGGHRDGGTIDFTTQVGSKHTFQAGAEYDFLKPTYNLVDPIDGLLATGLAGSNFEIGDFISPSAANCPGANLGLANVPGTNSPCGYLYKYFPNGPGPVPYNSEIARVNRQDTAFYLRDKFSPNDRTVIDYGFRFEGSNYQLPGVSSGCNPTAAQVVAGTTPDNCEYAPTGYTNSTVNGANVQVPYVSLSNDVKHPFVVEPRAAISLQLSRNDSLRLSFARSVEFAPIAFVDTTTPAGVYSRFANVPSFSAATGAAAMTCGTTGNLLCQNYGDQLRWEYQNNLEGVPTQPVKPETFSNYEISLSHQFPAGIGVKVTPFYRRGYDALALVAQPRLQSNGQPAIDAASGNIILGPSLATNLGQSRTTGVEFYLTKEAAYGLSGSLSATYINEFTNVVPSPLIQEDFFPPIPTQSLALGNQYRVGFVSPLSASLALSYKMHNGLRFNPIVTYSRGFPSGVGNTTAAYVNGVPYNIMNTNTAGAAAFGQSLSPNFVDPQNPGSFFKPNVAATRGTPESSSAGGFITNPRFITNLGVEFSPRTSHSTLGVLVTNLFNQTYSSVPTYNSRYQPVATGISGPKTGYSTIPINYPNEGFQQYVTSQFGNDPYRIVPSGSPTQYRLYYQLAL